MIQTKSIHLDLSSLPLQEKPLFQKLLRIFKTRVEERSGAVVSEQSGEVTVQLKLDPELPEDGFSIAQKETVLTVSASGFRGLVYGLGQLLHKSRYSSQGMTITDWRGTSKPDCSFRFMYFAIHFYNWYQNTSPESLERYCEDLMLWGYNGVCGLFGRISYDGWDDPRMEKALALQKKLFHAARSLELKTAQLLQFIDFKTAKPEFAADTTGIFGKNGNPICPEKPGAYEYIRDILLEEVRLLEEFKPDYLVYFPYDEGGCSCEKCAPWGGNGYYRIAKRMHKDIRSRFPELKSEAILATWHFNLGFNDPRDFPWLDRAIREDKEKGEDWISYITLETRRGVPEFIRENGVPGGVTAVDFPEITMHRLDPWGAFGANPLPGEIKRIFSDVQTYVDGGLTYTEGRFDDLNKALLAGFLWEKERTARENFDDYAGYEFTDAITEPLWDICCGIEENQLCTHHSRMEPADTEKAKKVWELAQKLDARLPVNIQKSWRWRILYLRCFLDHARYRAAEAANWPLREGLTVWRDRFDFWGKLLKEDPAAQAAFQELLEIYEMPKEYSADAQLLHFMVRPCHKEMYE